MKIAFKDFFITALLLVPSALAAQDQAYSTVKDASVALEAVVQTPDGGTDTVRITNKDILAALNATGDFNFSGNAKLLFRSVNSGIPFFVVRESVSNEVTTVDISDHLAVTEPDDAVHGRGSKVNWGIWNVTLNGSEGTDFTFWGLTVFHTGIIPVGNGLNLQRTVELNSIGSGAGHINGANAQISGKVSGNHGRIDL